MTVVDGRQGYALDYVKNLMKFIRHSPTPYHASMNLCDLLEEHGFKRLSEREDWDIQEGDRCYVTRNGTSLIAFRYGKQSKITHGMRIVGAHLDSPCLKLNPNSDCERFGYRIANVEVYGSVLLRTWFDRDLSFAGRVFVRDDEGKIKSTLVDWEYPLAVIPSIAIHLERNANTRQKINSQVQINPILLGRPIDGNSIDQLLQQKFEHSDSAFRAKEILSYDLRFYDVNPPQLIASGVSNHTNTLGMFLNFEEQYISSARIDNLLSCFAGAHALINADDEHFCMLVASDHEEVGSVSDSGAQGKFLQQVLDRIGGLDPRIIRRSVFISADGAHGMHPNYPDKHDELHRPILNKGPVIKINSNQRYATSDETEALIRNLCFESGIPVQTFVSRNDSPCGTTIGPLVATEIGIRTVDVGVAQFAMHSIRELAGFSDTVQFENLLRAFFESETVCLTD